MTSLHDRPVSQAPAPTDVRRDGPRAGSRPRRGGAWRLLTTFAAPGFGVYAVLVLVPLVLSFYYSLTNRSLLFPGEQFVGVDNYTRLLTDPAYLSVLGYTLVLTTTLVVGVNVLGLGVALLLNRMGRYFFALRMIFFIPVALSGVIVAFLWSRILTDDGVLNTALRSLGLDSLATSWLGQDSTAQASVAVVTGWQALGLCVVVYLAGLQTIPGELHEAARIDGAGPVRAFRSITWPLLAPAVTINSTLLLINGFKTYEIPIVLNGTGPGGATRTVATEVIRVGFNLNRLGLASAMAVVMLVLVSLIAAVMLLILQRREVAA